MFRLRRNWKVVICLIRQATITGLFFSVPLLWTTSVNALTIEIDKCYSIDGPANVRETPKGHVVGSLPDGKTVRVKAMKDKQWLLIEYCPENKKADCSSENCNKIVSWTHRNNLYPLPEPLEHLVKDGKVLIAAQMLDFFGQEIEKILGEDFSVENDENDFPQLGRPKQPLRINVYCLDGAKYKNEILSVSYEYGGDANAYLGKINLKSKLPKGHCILVNGIIESATGRSLKSTELRERDVCPKRDDEHSFCNYFKGDFNKDGIIEVLVRYGRNGAPYLEKWEIYELTTKGSFKLLGEVGSFVVP